MCTPEAADHALAEWGRIRRKILGTDQSLPSVLGRIRSQREAAHGEGVVKQQFGEVYSGDALLARRALDRCPEDLRELALVHYAIPMPAILKAKHLGLGRSKYWQRIDALRNFVAGVLTGLMDERRQPASG